MPHYTKKPVTIEARRFETNNDDGSHMTLLCDWANESKDRAVVTHDGTCIFIATLEGTMRADCGDWIIRGLEGELYPCKDSVFQATYAPAARAADSRGNPALSLAETQAVVDTKSAPRVTEASIKAKIADVEYFRVRHLTICIITLQNGFFVEGHSAPAAPENYDQQVGERYAYENAFRQLWPLEGYLLRQSLADAQR